MASEYRMKQANRVLPRERTGHSKQPLPTTKEKTLHVDITRWSTPKPERTGRKKEREGVREGRRKRDRYASHFAEWPSSKHLRKFLLERG